MSGGLLLQWLLRYNFRVAVAVGYIALFGIAVESGVVMVVYLHEALEHKLQAGKPWTNADLQAAAVEGAVQHFTTKLPDRLRRSRQPQERWFFRVETQRITVQAFNLRSKEITV
jgi:hypothetical protein